MNNNNYINNLNQLLSMGQNPQQIVQNAIAYNPQLQQVFSQFGNGRMSPREMVLQIASQRGIDINAMINVLQQKGIKM